MLCPQETHFHINHEIPRRFLLTRVPNAPMSTFCFLFCDLERKASGTSVKWQRGLVLVTFKGHSAGFRRGHSHACNSGPLNEEASRGGPGGVSEDVSGFGTPQGRVTDCEGSMSRGVSSPHADTGRVRITSLPVSRLCTRCRRAALGRSSPHHSTPLTQGTACEGNVGATDGH